MKCKSNTNIWASWLPVSICPCWWATIWSIRIRHPMTSLVCPYILASAKGTVTTRLPHIRQIVSRLVQKHYTLLPTSNKFSKHCPLVTFSSYVPSLRNSIVIIGTEFLMRDRNRPRMNARIRRLVSSLAWRPSFASWYHKVVQDILAALAFCIL